MTAGIPNEKLCEAAGNEKLDAFSTGLLPGFGVSHATHFSLLTSFLDMHVSHSHCVFFCWAARVLNKSSLATGGG